MAGAVTTDRKLDQTATWAVAVICAVMIIISILLEKVLHKLGAWFTLRHKRALYEALEKVKDELMILGFISLLLTFGQDYIAKICLSEGVVTSMLPCKKKEEETKTGRRLLWGEHRSLAAAGSVSCAEGKAQLVSAYGLHQLHILIFFLAVLHIIYSGVTMMLGRLKIRRWKEWEQETSSHGYEFSHDPSRFRLVHETSFVRAHTSFWTRIPFFFYIGCFFRQFFKSVGKADYLTLRNGFITAHLAQGTSFNFQKYIKRSLEDDFKVVVGVTPVLWASFVIFLLLNVHGWEALFWASIIPVILLLAIGTELQAILTKMALEIKERHAVVQGIPLVQGNDKYFWFGRPQLLLQVIHFTLFQNAFQLTYFLWIWYSFGLKSCFHENFTLVIIKICLGVGVLVMCSYITLPLYALITQMGSHMKKSIFDEQTSDALKKWHNAVKKKQDKGGRSPARTLGQSIEGGSVMPTPIHPSGPTLHRFKTTGHSARSHSSDLEAEPLSPEPSSADIIKNEHEAEEIEIMAVHSGSVRRSEEEFTFTKAEK